MDLRVLNIVIGVESILLDPTGFTNPLCALTSWDLCLFANPTSLAYKRILLRISSPGFGPGNRVHIELR